MKNIGSIICILTLLCLHIAATGNIRRETNGLRAGDSFALTPVTYSDTLSPGDNKIWDLSGVKLCGKPRRVTLKCTGEKDDSLCCVVGNTAYHFLCRGDSVIMLSFENNLSDMVYPTGEVQLLFPIDFNSEFAGHFSGSGRYADKWRHNMSGSYRTVADARGCLVTADGRICQVTDYYPYGLPMASSRNAAAQRWLFGGKELDRISGLDLYDFEARAYDPALARFTSPDRLQEKKSFISPYLYCRSNPIMFVDPTGLDEWEIDKNGKIVKHIKTNKHDAFFMVDNKGKRVDGKSLTFKYGTILKSSVVSLKKEKGSQTADIYRVRGDKQGTQLFEFLAKNTSVEWSHTQTGQKGSKGLNFISTSHQENENRSVDLLVRNQLFYSYTIRTMNHSHPKNTPAPSGYRSNGDLQAAATILSGINQPISFNIYLPKYNFYVPYGPDSKIEDFTQYVNLIESIDKESTEE